MIPNAAIAFALTCGVGLGGYAWGRADGRGLERAAMAAITALRQASLIEVGTLATEQAAAIVAMQATAARLTEEIENEARSDPMSATRVPSLDSLRRLERLWARERSKP